MLSNKIVLTGAIALALITPLVASAKSESKTYPISAQNASGEKGTVTLTADGDKTIVAVALTGAPASAQPAHIHPGTCTNLNPAPKYPLTSLTNGKSTTTVDATLASLTAGGFAVNVHKSPDDLKDYVACGDLGMAAMSGMKGMTPAATASP
jgi:Cu/Zn superoxide dismutase